MKTKHRFHQVLRWIADGNEIQYNPSLDNTWRDCDNNYLLLTLTSCPSAYHPLEFRIKPKESEMYITGCEHGYNRDATVTLRLYGGISENIKELLSSCTPVKIVSEQWYNEQINKR